jgi:hypothetical protein
MTGLITQSAVIPITGAYTVDCKLQLATPTEYGDGAADESQVVTTVAQNGTTVYTSLPGQEGFKFYLNCAANDLIAVTCSSAAAIDQPLNTVKCTVAIG